MDWPSNTNVGIVGGVDYIIESGSDNIYFHEMNTACGVYGSYATQMSVFNKMSDYADDKGCTTAYVYGQNDSGKKKSIISTRTINQFKFCTDTTFQ